MILFIGWYTMPNKWIIKVKPKLSEDDIIVELRKIAHYFRSDKSDRIISLILERQRCYLDSLKGDNKICAFISRREGNILEHSFMIKSSGKIRDVVIEV